MHMARDGRVQSERHRVHRVAIDVALRFSSSVGRSTEGEDSREDLLGRPLKEVEWLQSTEYMRREKKKWRWR